MPCIGTNVTVYTYTYTPKAPNETQNRNRHADQTEVFAFYISLSRQMPKQYLRQATTASFQILSYSSLVILPFGTAQTWDAESVVQWAINDKGHRSLRREYHCFFTMKAVSFVAIGQLTQRVSNAFIIRKQTEHANWITQSCVYLFLAQQPPVGLGPPHWRGF